MKLYLAGQYKQKDEISAAAETLRAAGHVITSRWLTEPHSPTITLDQISDAQLEDYALADLEDIDRADVLVAFSVDSAIATVRGGRHVEFGYALGRRPIIVVGPKENIFHYLKNRVIHVDDVEQLIEVIKP